MEPETIEEIKEVIMAELPGLMQRDPEMRNFIMRITREKYADKVETESRFDRLMEELKQDRKARNRKWEAQEKRWEEWEKKWNEERRAQDKKWEAQQKRWEEWEKKWDEERRAQDKKWEEWEKKWNEERKAQDKKWEAQDKKWEAQDKKWEAQEKKWEAQEKKWAENQRVINEMLESIKRLSQKHDSTIGALGARWGLHSESAFRNGLRSILEESFGVTVERYEDYDHEGIVFGRPDQVELDVIIQNGTLILCEIKSSMSKSDLYAFWRKKNFYEDKHARKASRAIVISPMIDDRARKPAEELNIELFGYAGDVKL